MAEITADRVLETSTTTGTGAFTLAGAVAGHQAFADVCSTSDTVYYSIWAVDGNGNPSGEWETGLGTYSGANTLTRTTPADSSNSGSAVNFSAGTKNVALSVTAGKLAGLGGGGGGDTVWTETLSAASSIDFEAFASGGYTSLHIEIDIEVSTAGAELTLQYKLNGAYKTADYQHQSYATASSGTNHENISASRSVIALSDAGATWGIGNGSEDSYSGTFFLHNPDNTTRTKRIHGFANQATNTTNNATSYFGGTYEGTDLLDALEGLRFAISSGTMTGTIRIRGKS